METTGFYKIKEEYVELIRYLGGKYNDSKTRPIYCCIQDREYPEIYWAIPTSTLANRTPRQIERIKSLCELPSRDLRSCYYHIGFTNREAIFKISNVLPIADKYIDDIYTSQGQHLKLRNTHAIEEINRKLRRILLTEKNHPNKFEQHITDVYTHLVNEIKYQKIENDKTAINQDNCSLDTSIAVKTENSSLQSSASDRLPTLSKLLSQAQQQANEINQIRHKELNKKHNDINLD